MLVQIYEVTTPQEARALCALGVDHIGILVGDGTFPREQSWERAVAIAAAVVPPGKVSALFLSANVAAIIAWARVVAPACVHLGAALELLGPADCQRVREAVPGASLMRSIPVTGEVSLGHAHDHAAVADFLLLDSHREGDRQIGALGIVHDWRLSRRIARSVSVPTILAGGLGPENVREAIARVGPAGVDSKTNTDIPGTHIKDVQRVRAFIAAAKGATFASERLP
jgi:phosphoribosylanthranilate isomerase